MKQLQPAPYPRDFFLHLLVIVSLYASVGSAVVLSFQIVNVLLPDPVDFYYRGILEAIRTSSATLVVFYPVFFGCALLLQRELARFPQKAEYRVRKWLLYFTLFVAALAIIGDLVALTKNFFSGELTVKFVLKVLIVLVLSGVVFGYVLWEVKEEKTGPAFVRRLAGWGSAGAVVASLVLAFVLVGSPAHQRKVRLDEERVMHLQQIQWEVVSYWDQKGELPQAMDALIDDIRGFVPPRDPETDGPYMYRSVAELKFELCAIFAAPTPKPVRTLENRMARPVVNEFGGESWVHESGLVCFSRTIDPERHGTRGMAEPIPKRPPVY